MGEWRKTSGSSASQKKVYLGKAIHYYPKSGIGESKIEAFNINTVDQILITGPTTGAREHLVDKMYVDDIEGSTATKGMTCTFRLPFRVRLSDKIYKLVET